MKTTRSAVARSVAHWSCLLWLLIACAKPHASSLSPGRAALKGQEAIAARRYAGCWAVHNLQPDAAGEMAELVILELDTVVVFDAGVRPSLLRAVGRSGVKRLAGGRDPEYGWSVLGADS